MTVKMMKYILDSSQKIFKKQLIAFVNETGLTGIFKKNISDTKTIIGEESLGFTKSGQLVKIRFDGKTLEIET